MSETAPERKRLGWLVATSAIALGASAVAVAGVVHHFESEAADASDSPSLTAHDIAVASKTAHSELDRLDGAFRSASVKLVRNRNLESNTGTKCASDRVLELRLIGRWGSLQLGGAEQGHSGPWQAMDDTLDRKTGAVCLRASTVGPSIEPAPGSRLLFGRS